MDNKKHHIATDFGHTGTRNIGLKSRQVFLQLTVIVTFAPFWLWL